MREVADDPDQLPAGRIVGPPPGATGADWLDWRQRGIGASEAAAVLGLSSWGSPWTVWLAKTGQTSPRMPSRAMKWGSRLEAAIVDAFGEETGAEVTHRQAWVEWRTRPELRATLDGIATRDGTRGVLEVKTTNGRDGAWDDGVPVSVQLQVQHQMIVTGLPVAWVACLSGGQDFAEYELEADSAVQSAMAEIELRFWREHVRRMEPPPVDSSEPTGLALRAFYPEARAGSVDLPTEAASVIEELQEVKDQIRAAKAREVALDNLLMGWLGEHDTGTLGGRPAVTWRPTVTRRVDLNALRKELPDVAERYTLESRSRTLRLVGKRQWRDSDGG